MLGLVLPSNSPGVHTLWLPVIPMQIGLVLKPGPQEPWTPYPHGGGVLRGRHPARSDFHLPGRGRRRRRGARRVRPQPDLRRHGRRSTAIAAIPRVQAHGPGFSKILLGDDQVDNWEKYLDVMVDSVFVNSGRGCINCSGIWASRHTAARSRTRIAQRLASVRPLPPDDPEASLAAFTVPGVADADFRRRSTPTCKAPGVDRRHGDAPRRRRASSSRGAPTTCCRRSCTATSPEAAIAKKEYMFPFVTVVECPEAQMLDAIGPTLVCSADHLQPGVPAALLDAVHIDRLNLGPVPTTQLNWLQPHEGNIVEFLFRARAFQTAAV